MRGELEVIHFKMIYHERNSKVTDEMKLITSAKLLVTTNSHTNITGAAPPEPRLPAWLTGQRWSILVWGREEYRKGGREGEGKGEAEAEGRKTKVKWLRSKYAWVRLFPKEFSQDK